MNNLREVFQKYAAVVFFDTETSGLNPDTDQIIELAAIRVERAEDGHLYTVKSMDDFIKLPEGQKLPERIVDLTKISDEILAAEGGDENDAVYDFEELIDDSAGPVLLVAHNAQFDLQFVTAMTENYNQPCNDYLIRADYLDTVTVYKDRRAYPHKLANAIIEYGLQDKVQNSHRAIDDVAALFEVCKAIDDERPDLLTYVNIFGYNPKYGVSGRELDKVQYCPQPFTNHMQPPDHTLPQIARRGMFRG